jgi:isoleucyl-tRNA synthetase
VLTFGQAPYLSVLNQEHVLDAKGRKMSKRLGNVILTTDAVKRLGADPVRLYLLWKAPVWERKNFDEHEVQLLRGQFFTVLWNCYLFYTTYALSDLRKPKGHQIEDRWILSRINSLLRDLDGRLVRYDLHGAVRIICDFLLKELSRWYIKLIRDRTWPAYRGADKKAALATLHAVLHKLTLALAPFCPFIAERAYQDIFKEQESVHLCSWPLADRKLINKKLEGQMEIAKRIVEAAAAARADAKIKLRYPLRTLIVTGSRDVLAAARALSTVIGTMANVKQVKIKKIKAEMLVKLNWPIAGKRFGARAKQLAAALARADAVRLKEEIDKKGRAMLGPFMLTAEDLIFTEKAEGTGREFPGGKVFLDTAVTPELRSEWLVRELIRAVQNKRKQLGLTVTDRVLLYLPDAQTFKPWTKIISYETGSRVILGKLRGMKAAFEFERRKYAFGVEHEKAP